MTTLVRWEPFRELASFQSELSRFMNGLLDGPGRVTQNWVPALDVWETPTEVVYAFDLPGIPEDGIAIEVKDDMLTVSAERERVAEAKDDRFYRFERRFGSFARSIGLPQGVTEDSIRAEYKNGVLELHVTKPKAPEPRRIQIGKGVVEGTVKQK